jgi:hypothetical protein
MVADRIRVITENLVRFPRLHRSFDDLMLNTARPIHGERCRGRNGPFLVMTRHTAEARQKEIKVNITVVATKTFMARLGTFNGCSHYSEEC